MTAPEHSAAFSAKTQTLARTAAASTLCVIDINRL
jgi:hypothetical protein